MKRPYYRWLAAMILVGLIALSLVILAPVGRPTLADADPGPSPIPMSAIDIPIGGVAIVCWSRAGETLVTVPPDGAVTYEAGTARRTEANPTHLDGPWTWQRTRGIVPTRVELSPNDVAQFIAAAKAIPSDHLFYGYEDRVCPGGCGQIPRWAVVRDDTLVPASSGEPQPLFAYLGYPAPRSELVMPTPPPVPPIPFDAVAFIYENAIFVLHRTGAITMQYGEILGRSYGMETEPAWYGDSLTYDVRPISPLLAWKIVTFAPLVYVPPGCPDLDDSRTYRGLMIVTNNGINNGLFCHSWAPMRDDLMSVVRVVSPGD